MSRRLRKEVWNAWWKSADGEKLLWEFKSRTPSDEERPKIAELIAKLGDPAAEKREAATTELVGYGTKATGMLRKTIYNNPPRIGPFALEVLESIEKDTPAPLPGAAPRLLGLRKPKGSVETLLAYAPVAESDEIFNQIVEVAAAAGCDAGKADPGLVKGLESPVAERRMLAVMALCRGKATEEMAEMKKVLKDKDTLVRLRAAQGMAGMGEKTAVPALIGLLKDLPIDLVWEAEESLLRIADEKRPTAPVTADVASRDRAHKAWSDWWTENEQKVVLNRVESLHRDLGYLLVVESWSNFRPRGRVAELDPKGKVRWEITDLNWPTDAQVLRNGNVLLVEQNSRVSERDKKGKVVGVDRVFNSPFALERLANGHTFVACRNQLLIVDAKGANVFAHNQFNQTILGARRFRDGSIAYVTYTGTYHRLDRTGKEVKTLNFGPWVNFSLNGAEILPGDKVVVSIGNMNKVAEYGPDNKQNWERAIPQPMVPTRMSNGNILVGGGTNNGQTIYELDRRGQIVREMKDGQMRVYRAIRR